MKAEDLIIGKCYVYDKDVIVLFKGINAKTKCLSLNREYFKTVKYGFNLPDIRIATPEEEHWYNECIKKDTYVPRRVAMASFAKTVAVSTNPAYVRCVVCDTTGALFKKGNVYKTYPGKYMQGYVYLKPDGRNTISDYPLDGVVWKFEPCEGPETSFVASSEAKTEVFGKFIIGNIVVSLRNNMPYREEGDMFTVLPMSKQDRLYYKPSTHSQDSNNWRLATTKEVIAYHNGVKNIKQMSNTEETPIQTKVLTLQDIKADQYYYAEYSDKKGGSAVIKSTQNGSFKSAPGVRLDDDIYCPSNTWDCNKNIRLATADEITHLDCCRAHGTYMTKQRASELKIREVPSPSNAKKWAVRRTEANYKVLNAWANSQDDIASGHSSSGGWMHSINYGMSGHSRSGHYFADDTKHPDHTEISFEQFQREYLKSNPKINVEPVITKTMNPDKWCIEMDYDHPDRLEVINFINVAWKAGMTGSGGFYYLENGKVKCNALKPEDYDLMSISQFKRDIMTSSTQSVPYVFTLPPQWYMLVTEENKYDAEVWRWDGNPAGYNLDVGMLIGIPDYGGKALNPGKATTNFGTEISYIQFKTHVLTKEEKGRLITSAFPVGSCVVVTKGSYGKNGKENHCYKIIEHTGLSNGDISLKYQSCNSIGLSHVRVKRATTDQTARYEREGKPYDTKVSEVSNTVAMTPDGEPIINDPYAGKSIEEMLVICRQMFPKGCTYRKKDEIGERLLDQDLIIQSAGAVANNERGISNIGLPWFFFNGTMRVELVSPPDNVLGINVHKSSGVTTSWSHTKPDKGASEEELLAYCKKMYPIGTIILDTTGKYQYTITEEIFWSAGCFISHNGIPIVYDRSGHYFASIAGHAPKEESLTKTLKDLSKKATLSDVSALVKHQEPVIAFSKKAKRSKLIIINK